jgi:hypothetical protein
VSVLARAPSLINFLDALNAAVAASRRRSVEDPCTERSPSGSLRKVLLLPYPTVDAFA